MLETPFMQEVLAQPSALRTFLEKHRLSGFSPVEKAQALLENAKRVIFTGMGTSFYAPLLFQNVLLARGWFHVEAGELYEYHAHLLNEDTTLVMLSQSGESAEMIKLLKMRPQGLKVIAITNDPNSTLARACDVLLELFVKEERTVTNATFTNTLALLQWLLSPADRHAAIASEFWQVSLQMDTFLSDPKAEQEIQQAASLLQPAHHAYFIGRGGPGAVCANQAALIFSEGAKCVGRGLTAGSFRHGPMETCSMPDHRAVIFGQDDACLPKTLGLCRQMAALKGHTVFIGAAADAPASASITLPDASPGRYPYLAAIAFEWLMAETAHLKGLTAGQFQICSKITTEE